jgi:ribonucleoside-diphosphate reductase alpha chain
MTKELKQKKLPKTRKSITHEFVIAGVKGFVTVGMYNDDKPGEIFIAIAKEGSTLGGLFNVISIVTSMALQHGVSIDKLAAKLSYMAFPPQGFTGEEFGYASSIVDYIFRWLGKTFGTKEVKEEKRIDEDLSTYVDKEAIQSISDKLKNIPVIDNQEEIIKETVSMSDMKKMYNLEDAPACTNCGGIMVRNGACYKCMNCGETSGCS